MIVEAPANVIASRIYPQQPCSDLAVVLYDGCMQDTTVKKFYGEPGEHELKILRLERKYSSMEHEYQKLKREKQNLLYMEVDRQRMVELEKANDALLIRIVELQGIIDELSYKPRRCYPVLITDVDKCFRG